MFKKYKEKFIGDREFYANLIRLIIPMIVQQGITSFVSLLDNVMVGPPRHRIHERCRHRQSAFVRL